MKRVATLFFFTTLLSFFAFSQNILVTGTVKDAGQNEPQPGVTVAAAGATTTTDETGAFRLEVSAAEGTTLKVTFSKEGFTLLEQEVKLRGQRKVDLGILQMEAQATAPGKDAITGEDRIPIITLSGDDEESELGNQNISGILSASRDPFIAAAAYNLSTGGFEIRGYDAETVVLFNGMPFNTLESGAVFWSSWGGLNDVTRNRESSIDLSASPYSFGGVGGVTAFDLRASEQRRQKRFSYMISNRTYNNRIMGTWSTGMLPGGWAFSFSGSKRWAKEGYVPGTFYGAYSYFGSIDKKLGENHLLNLTALGSPVRRGSQGASVQEANDLAGTNFYNPNWGWQDGRKRNARVVTAHQPLVLLRHDWKLSDNATLMTAAGYQFGRYGRTNLDWFIAPDPRPDYYRKLPVYYALDSDEIAEEVRQAFLENPDLLQIQWDELYKANVNNNLGETNLSTEWQSFGFPAGENMSQYVLGEERSDANRLNGSSTYQNIVSDHLTINFGLTFQQEKTHYFKTLDDLLGGDYYTNLDHFAFEEKIPGQSPSYNLENSNVIVREGDTYGWDFDITGRQFGSWLQGQFSFKKFDFFLAGDVSRTDFWRTGHFRNGRFPDNSFGDSEKQDYTGYGVKGGITYKINGRNYLYANGAALTRPPDSRTAYASSRNRDALVPGLQKEQIYAAEGGYQLRSPNVKARATFFYTQFNNDLKLNRFYLAGDVTRFGTYILTSLDRRHAGIEVAVQAKLSPSLTATGAASVGEYIYTSRPKGYFIIDDDGLIQDRGTIYIKNFYVPSTPQTAASIGLEYRSAKFWSASVTVNYFDRTYLDFSPERRRAETVFGLEQGSDFYNSIVYQQKVPDAYTVDLFANKSFKITDDVFFYLTGGVTNLLDATVITGGYEQLRFDRGQVEGQGINVWPPKNYYAFGTNFFLMGAVRF